MKKPIYLKNRYMKFDTSLRKKIIFFIFFLMPGGFILLSIMLFFDEFILRGNHDEINPK